MPRQKKHNSELVLVLVLFMVYALSALMISSLGVESYGRTVSLQQEGFNERSGILYLAQKVQQNDIGGGIRITTYLDNDALVLTEQATGEGFETWIFIQDGYLSELQIAAGAAVIPQLAQHIMPMQALELEFIGNNLLRVCVTTDSGSVNSMHLAIRSSGDDYNATGTNPPPSPSGSFTRTATGDFIEASTTTDATSEATSDATSEAGVS